MIYILEIAFITDMLIKFRLYFIIVNLWLWISAQVGSTDDVNSLKCEVLLHVDIFNYL